MSVALPSPEVVLGPTADREPSPRDVLALRFHRSAATLAIVVAVVGLVTLVGWLFHLPALVGVSPGLVPMKANAGLVLVLTGVALWLYRLPELSPRALTILRVCTGLAIGLSVLTLIEHTTGWNLRIDQLIAADPHALGGAPGRMAWLTATCGVLINTAMLVSLFGLPYGVAQSLVGTTVLLTTLNTVGYFLTSTAASADPAGPYHSDMAVQAAISVLLACLAFFFARPTRGLMEAVIDPGPGGMVIRHLLPVVFVLPLLLAWVSWQGVVAHAYDPAFAIALVITLTIIVLGIAVWVGGRVLRRYENKRVVAEAERQESEDRLRRAVSGAPVPMVIHNGDHILHMSRGWAEVSGYTVEDTPTLSAWVGRAQPEQAATVNDYLAAIATATDTISSGEQRVVARDGSERIWEFSTTPVGTQGDAGRVFVSMAADVTARKRAERELRRLNEELEQRISDRTAELILANDVLKRQSDQLKEQATLLDLVRDGILVRDLRGTIIYWSAGAVAMYGWDMALALGKVSHELLKAEYGRPLAEIEAQVMSAGFWEGEVVHTTRSGARIPVESRWTLTRTERGAPEGFLEVNRDITGRKQAQDSLRDSQVRFRAVAETASEGIISVDRKGIIQYWNPGAERLFDRPAAEAVGQPLSLALPDPSLNPYRQLASDHPRAATFESVGQRRNGKTFPLELSVTSWSNTQGDKFFTCIVRDITAHKASERALQDKAQELARSNEELQQFAYVASHDLQEPLRMVANYTQLLGRRYKDKLDADANEFIEFAVDGAKRMQDLIHDLLEYARVGTGGREFRPVPADRMAAAAIANLASAIDDLHAEVILDPLPTLNCDEVQLSQVFQNLIANGIKFHRADARPLVRVSAARSNGGWLLTVTDNGIGIEARYFDRIFQMFQRLHARADYPGTGIGLSLSKKIIERHGGHISVTSQPGSGTTFSFTIPDGVPPSPES
ncbi:MAG: PAS domain S-box protein [Vicinamibacterales bacterium]